MISPINIAGRIKDNRSKMGRIINPFKEVNHDSQRV